MNILYLLVFYSVFLQPRGQIVSKSSPCSPTRLSHKPWRYFLKSPLQVLNPLTASPTANPPTVSQPPPATTAGTMMMTMMMAMPITIAAISNILILRRLRDSSVGGPPPTFGRSPSKASTSTGRSGRLLFVYERGAAVPSSWCGCGCGWRSCSLGCFKRSTSWSCLFCFP